MLARRRMVRRYTPEQVSTAALERIAAAALAGPSAGNSRGVSVVIVTDPAVRAEVASAAGEPEYLQRGFDPWISSAPALLAICVSEEAYHRRYAEADKGGSSRTWTIPYWWVDAGAALMAVLLAAVDEDLAAGFLGSHSIPELTRILNLPDGVTAIGVVTIGHPAQDRRSGSLGWSNQSGESTVHYDRWEPGRL